MRYLIVIAVTVLLAGLLWAGLAYAEDPQQDPAVLTVHTDDGLTMTLDQQGQITSVLLDGQELVGAAAPAVTLRDLSHAGDEAMPNLLAGHNPSFEAGLSGWTQVKGQAPLTGSITTTVAFSGSASLALHAPMSATGLIAYAAEPVSGIVPGQHYRLSAHFRSREGVATSPSGSVFLWQRDIWEGTKQPGGVYVLWQQAGGGLIGAPVLAGVLHTNAYAWKKVGGEVVAPPEAVQAQVVVAAKLDDDQTVWVDAVRLEAAPEPAWPVLGTVIAGDNVLTQTATITGELRLTVTYRGQSGRIDVSGVVKDTSGQPRAMELEFGLPVALDGWTWWDDVLARRTITQGLYANQISALFTGWQPMSLHSLAAVEDGTHGLTLALPDTYPQVAALGYDADESRYRARFSLGISPLATKLNQSANFDLALYRFDSGCAGCPDGSRGFREALVRHHAWFGADPHPERDIYSYDGAERAFYLSPRAARQVISNNLNNIYSAQYTVLEFSLDITTSTAPRPDYEDVLALIDSWSQSPQGTPPYSLSLSISNSVAIDTNGDQLYKLLKVPQWDPEHWVAILAGDWNPEIEQGGAWINDLIRVDQAMRMTEQIGAHLDGIFIDNYISNPGVDLAPTHLALANYPLTFDPNTYRPGKHLMAGAHEYVEHLRQHLDDRWGEDRGIVINFWGLGTPNSQAALIDGFGGEGDPAKASNWSPPTLAYRRAIAYHRPCSFANQSTLLDDEGVRRFAAEALFWGVVPSVGANAGGWISNTANLQVLSDTVQTLQLFWADGWEPLTNAATDQPDVWVERFGRAPNSAVVSRTQAAGLAFTVHNSGDVALTYTLSISASAVGIVDPAAVMTVTEIVSGVQVPTAATGGLLQITAALPGHRTAVYQIECRPADVNCDGHIDVVDVQQVAARWQEAAPLRSPQARYDLDTNRIVDVIDIMLAASRWQAKLAPDQTGPAFNQPTSHKPLRPFNTPQTVAG